MKKLSREECIKMYGVMTELPCDKEYPPWWGRDDVYPGMPYFRERLKGGIDITHAEYALAIALGWRQEGSTWDKDTEFWDTEKNPWVCHLQPLLLALDVLGVVKIDRVSCKVYMAEVAGV